MKRRIFTTLLLGILICFNPVTAQKKKEAAKEPEKKETGLSSSTFSGLSFRSIGLPGHREGYQILQSILKIILKSEFPPVLACVTKAGEDLQELEKQLDAIGAPWTTGRVPKL